MRSLFVPQMAAWPNTARKGRFADAELRSALCLRRRQHPRLRWFGEGAQVLHQLPALQTRQETEAWHSRPRVPAGNFPEECPVALLLDSSQHQVWAGFRAGSIVGVADTAPLPKKLLAARPRLRPVLQGVLHGVHRSRRNQRALTLDRSLVREGPGSGQDT